MSHGKAHNAAPTPHRAAMDHPDYRRLLITAGVILLLFVAWQLWWTNIDADRTQSQAVSTLVQEFDAHPAKPRPAGTLTPLPPG